MKDLVRALSFRLIYADYGKIDTQYKWPGDARHIPDPDTRLGADVSE